MAKMNVFQKEIAKKRDDEILELAKQGYRLREIAETIEKKYRYPISRARIHQIINNKLQGGEQ